jgi:bacterioferritin-associated ferredoxin
MYVCNCNGVRARDMNVAVDAVLDSGAASVQAVYRACGVTPKCGRCAHDIKRLLDARLGEAHIVAAE